jgi:choloylglycine hydrolase
MASLKMLPTIPAVDDGELVQNMKPTIRPTRLAMQRLFSRVFAALCATSALLIQPCIACTGLSIQATDGGMVTGRTLEFGADPQSQIVVFPAGTEFVGTVPKGTGLKFKSLYGFAGANGFGVHDAIIDGLNEKGLYVGLFYFPACAKYMEPTQDNNAKGLAPWEFGTWVLANFSTVDEVNTAIAKIALVPTYLNTLKEVPPAHYKIQDAKGHCIVVEPTDGQLKVYDNPVWAMANSPEFPWHLTNLNNYIHLSAVYPASKTIRGLSLAPFGMGGGLVGLPGDFTPPSRFIRIATYLQNLQPQETTAKAVKTAFHLLNNFDLPPGSNNPPAGTAESYSDYTAWTTVSDLKNLQFHWKTFDDQRVRFIDLNKVLAKAGSESLTMEMGDQSQEDMGDQLK